MDATRSDITLELPAPPSVNLTRKVYWRGHKALERWHGDADYAIAVGRRRPAMERLQRFEIYVVVSERGCDLDNLKAVADYLKRIEVIADDSRKHMRRLVVEIGDVPDGMIRVTVRPL